MTQRLRILFSHGYRPFFLLAGLNAWASMLPWLYTLSGGSVPTQGWPPQTLHAHEMIFGTVVAVIAGFLMTAVPNWTGRLPIVGWRLGGLAALWLAGRIAVMVSFYLPTAVVAIIDLSFPLLLFATIGREIVVGRNWRNLIVLGMLAVLTIGNALFHWEAALGDFAARGVGFRLSLCTAIMMIAVIGGRIVPSFTRNWLVKHNPGRLPTPPMQRFDKVTLLVLLAAVILWVALPSHISTGVTLVLAGALHLIRLMRWAGHRTLAEPLVTVLHLGYIFLPLGALAIGAEVLTPDLFGKAAAQHLWMGGAIGLMTLAVMTRATLGHTGRPLTANRGTCAIYAALIIAVLARVCAGVWPTEAAALHVLSGGAWLGAFAGFAVLYGRLLLYLPPAKSI